MPHRTPSPSDVVWWARSPQVLTHPIPISATSPSSSDGVITVPARGTKMPATRAKMLGILGCISPEAQFKIETTSPKIAKRVAVRFCESMKQHGLKEAAERVFIKVKARQESLSDERNTMKELMEPSETMPLHQNLQKQQTLEPYQILPLVCLPHHSQ